MDASKKAKLGLGGHYGDDYMQGAWDEKFIDEADPSIQYLELFATTTGILAWSHKMQNSRVILFSDNMSVVVMLNKTIPCTKTA